MTREQYIVEKLTEELTPINVEDETKNMLDQVYDFRCVGGPFQYLYAGDVLEHYDHCAFREEVNNYIDAKLRDGSWIEYEGGYWSSDAKYIIRDHQEAIKNCDPFYVGEGEHRGWFYHDEEAFAQGPFCDPYDCYEHAVSVGGGVCH